MRVLSRLGLVALAVMLTAATARAQWRDPQVPVQGTALQQALAALGQSIRVGSEQRDAQWFSGVFLTRPPLFFIASAAAGGASLSLYNAGQAGSPLFEVLPAPLAAGWRATTTFSMSPPTAIVNLYDGAGQPQGGTTYGGVQAFLLGFAVRDAAGTAWSEDAFNPGGQARLLYFLGTGAHTGDAWLAAETDGDGDFADALFLLEYFAPVPVERATWGALKRRFR